jgi:predicted molibdopterin-dependent oxidoreductase YjgC
MGRRRCGFCGEPLGRENKGNVCFSCWLEGDRSAPPVVYDPPQGRCMLCGQVVKLTEWCQCSKALELPPNADSAPFKKEISQ